MKDEMESRPEPKPSANRPIDDRHPNARAMDLASRILSVCLTPVIPPAAGYWADGKLGTVPWLFILGLVFGIVAGWVLFRRLLEFLSHEEDK